MNNVNIYLYLENILNRNIINHRYFVAIITDN